MPVAVKGGFAYGAYSLRPTSGRTIIDVVLLPQRSGKLGIKVTVDSMADAKGRRIAHLRDERPRPRRAPWASPRRLARPGPVGVPGSTARGAGTARFGIPAANGRVTPLRAARGLRSLYGTRHITKRDQDYARQAWTQARAKGQVCDASAATRPQRRRLRRHRRPPGDPRRHGRTAGPSAIRPVRTVTRPTIKPDKRAPRPPPRPATSRPMAEAPAASSEPAATDAPGGRQPRPARRASGRVARRRPPVTPPAARARAPQARPPVPGRTSVPPRPATSRAGRSPSTAPPTPPTRPAATASAPTPTARCTLRAAIAEADYLKGDDRIEFDLRAPRR